MSKYKLRDADVEFIREVLRHESIKWEGRNECLDSSRKRVFEGYYKNGKKKFKYHYQCAMCKVWYREREDLEVDHVVEIGSFNGDWNEFLHRHFPPDRKAGLQALCIGCHLKKTKAFNSARSKFVRKK